MACYFQHGSRQHICSSLNLFCLFVTSR